MNFRTLGQLAVTIANRARFSNVDGLTYGGKRDLYEVLGYKRQLFAQDYRSRFRRNEIANRIVKALPQGTWRGGADIIEDDDPTTETAFEAAFADLDNRLKIWDAFKKADILAGIYRYAVILIGAPGEMDQPLEAASADEIAYLMPYAEEDAPIQAFDNDPHSERFGKPTFYTLKRTALASTAANAIMLNMSRKVHYSRIIHIADGTMDDNIYGTPRLECVWNRLDDLEKVAGGGAEAFWRRADQGKQFDLDPTMDLTPEQVTAMEEEVDKFVHQGKRTMRTRGMKINSLGSDVADFKSPVESIISLISAGTGIPQRVLMGSEQGKLAAKQDRISWDNRITDRQNDYAGPCIVRPLVDRLIELGALPQPVDGYDVRFSSISTMDDEQRADIAKSWASLSQLMGQTVVTPNEIRERVLQMEPLEQIDTLTVAAAAKGGQAWKKVHRAADRFRPTFASYRQRLIRRRQTRNEPQSIGGVTQA